MAGGGPGAACLGCCDQPHHHHLLLHSPTPTPLTRRHAHLPKNTLTPVCAKILARTENFSFAITICSSFGKHMAPRSGPPENWAEVRELQENFALLSRWWVALRAPPPPPVAKQAQGQAAIAIMAKYFLYISLTKILLYFLQLATKSGLRFQIWAKNH